jgi:serine/threonine protein kinase
VTRVSPRKEQLIGGKYRLAKPLAQGGMGSVWVARHVQLEVDVAIKFRTRGEELDATAIDRFKREAQAAAQLKSPHVVHIHDYGLDDGTPFIAMELLQGEDLGELLDRVGRLSLRRTLELISQAAKGLEAAHQAGIVHRDIKPRNLFLARLSGDEVLKILDFGIAKRTSSDDGGATSANVILGSPSYMSPEQARGTGLDRASDVWSLAAVAYRALTGVPPFQGESSQDTVIKICTEEAPPASSHCPDLPEAIDGLFQRALAREACERFASPSELVKALRELVERHPDHGLPERPAQTKDSRGRLTRTETLAPHASHAERKNAPNLRRRLLLGVAALALAAGALLVLAGGPSPEPKPQRAVVRPNAQGENVAPKQPSPAQAEPAPALASPEADTAPPPRPEPSRPPPQTRKPPAATAPRARPRTTPRSEAPKSPELDPIFGLPVSPAPSTIP